MKFLALIIALTIGLLSCSRQQYTVIEDVNVFDGERVLQNVDFVFSSKGIESISTTKKRFKNSTIIDGEGKTILPPMINAHVHVRSEENLKEALSVGVFALLDMFSTDRKANNLRVYNDSLDYARFYSSNVGATPPGGHGTQFGINIPTINKTISPQQFVKDRVSQHADYIKITQEYTMSRLDKIQLKELIDEAHEQKMVAVSHVSDLQSGMDVVAQDVDGLAHLWYRNGSISTDRDLNLIRKKETFIIPTLSVILNVIDQSKEKGRENNYLTSNELKNEVRKLHRKGVRILAGTDSPHFYMNYSTQLFEEMILLNACGLSEIEVLKSATSNIYEHFNLKEFGNLGINANSSFVLVTGKPYRHIEDIKNEKRIWKNGIEII